MTNKEIVTKANELFGKADIEGFLELCADNVTWNMPNMPSCKGKEELRSMMNEMGMGPMNVTVLNTIAEGDLVATNGRMVAAADEATVVEYCDVYRLSNGKVVEMTSYAADVKQEQQ